MKRFNKITIIIAFIALVTASCAVDTDDSPRKSKASGVEYGSITLKSKSASRALNVSDIKSVDISVMGHGMTAIEKNSIPVTDGTFNNITIDKIPVGKNRVVTAAANTTIESVISKMAGVELSAVKDIEKGANTVTLNWGSTAAGNVYKKLIALNYDVSNVTPATVTALIPSDTHAALIDTDAIAADIKAGSTKSADDYKIEAGSVTVTCGATIPGAVMFISDPCSAKISSISSTQTITGMAPGNWTLYIISGKSVLHSQKVTIKSGVNDSIALAVKMRQPRLENEDGSVTDESIPKGGNKTVYLRVRGDVEGEEAQTCDIYYTKGTKTSAPADPTESSTKYDDTTGITGVTDGTVIKAIAVKTGFTTSDVVTFTFVTPTLGYTHPVSGAGAAVDESGWGTSNWALGANVNGADIEFALYSANATKILLEIYDAKSGADAKYDYWMQKGSDNIWRAKVVGAANVLYAYRCWGPNWPYDAEWVRGNSDAGFISDCDSSGNRFNPNKVVFDPRARELSHDKSNPDVMKGVNGGIYGTGADAIKVKDADAAAVARRIIDTGKYCPKGVVIADTTDFGTKPKIAQKDAIIYEAHARGLTKHPSATTLSTILNGIDGFDAVQNVPEDKRGTYAGAAMMVPYLKALGVNTIELLPIHESDNDANPDDAPGGNYWAYMTYGYYAPDRRYSSDKTPGGPTKEFKEMVKAFHDAGMEVYLDVVYNHSGEGGVWGSDKGEDPTTCEITFMRGIDNKTYYEICNPDNAYYYNHTGCGNDLQCDNAVVRAFIIDSLTYWITSMGVDGFRFDLAPVLGHVKGSDGKWNFSSNAKTLTDIAALGASNNVEMIAEAWDAGGCYQVGNFPNGWGEWNGRYRDSVRRYIGTGNKGDVNDYIYGDYNHFYDQGGPSKSVNFIVAHDGFTLADLSTYGGAGNANNSTLKWPFGPSDGGNGDTNSVPDSTSEGKRQTHRNYLAIQMISRGVPMIVWGDEFGRTQNGNNNPYNIDSVATWNNYNMINTKSPHAVATGGEGTYHNNFGTFGLKDDKTNTGSKAYSADLNGNFILAKYLLNLRQKEPAFNTNDYSTVKYNFEKEDGSALTGSDNCVRLYIAGSAVTGGSDYCVLLNIYDSPNNAYTIPTPPTGKVWKRLVDTQKWFEPEYNCWDEKSAAIIPDPKTPNNKTYSCGARSIVILKACDETYVEKCATPVIAGTDKFTGTSNSVTITSATEGAEIYYTTDGSIPTNTASATNLKYTAAISISDTSLIKAVAFPPTSSTLAQSEVAGKLFVKTETPATYDKGGVMIQGFNWSSAKKDATPDWYSVITNRASDIKAAFAYIWLPPPSKSNGDAPQGYLPTELNVLDNRYGTEAQLNTMLSALYSGGTGTKAIADIVINHRAGTTCWGDFTNPSFGVEVERDANTNKVTKGVNYRAICSNDEGFNDKLAADKYDVHMSTTPLNMRGAADTGEGYDAARDLDHTNLDVQFGIIKWMESLKTKGFNSWRYDFVKGYGGQYVGLYNSATAPEFSIGEYWPSDGANWTQSIDEWVSATATGGYRSKAFDFVLKSNMNALWGFTNKSGAETAGDGKYTHLADGTNLFRKAAADAVTFVDNHDTGSTQGEWKLTDEKVPLAYVLTLTHPGYPCVAWQHYFTAAESGIKETSGADYAQYISGKAVPGTVESTAAAGTASKTLRQHIDTLIALRKAAGVECDSTMEVLLSSDKCYAAKITGTKSGVTNNELIIVIGDTSAFTPQGTDDYKGKHAVYAGDNFVIWQKGVVGTYGHEIPDLVNLTITVDDNAIKGGRSVWVWNWAPDAASGVGQWIKGEIVASSERKSATFVVPKTNTNAILVETDSATTGDNIGWDVAEGTTGHIYRKTADLSFTPPTTGDSATITTLFVTEVKVYPKDGYNAQDWVVSNDVVFFAYAWEGADSAKREAWVKGNKIGSGASGYIQVFVPEIYGNCLITRCHIDTTTPDWSNKSNPATAGKIYNKTGDIVYGHDKTNAGGDFKFVDP